MSARDPEPLSRTFRALIRRRARQLIREEVDCLFFQTYYALLYQAQVGNVAFDEVLTWTPRSPFADVCTPRVAAAGALNRA
jgi:hypothetical protein